PILLDAMSEDGPVAAPLVTARTVLGLPDALREEQTLFGSTGGVHAAGLFRLVREGAGVADRAELLAVREDVGRHNAVDKVIGWALQQGMLPLHDTVLQV